MPLDGLQALDRVQRSLSALRTVAKAVLPSIPPYNPDETSDGFL